MYRRLLTIFTCSLLHAALENFILFARRNEIYRISLDVDEFIDVRLPLVNLTGATALDWDDRTDKIFWTDLLLNTINSANSDVSIVYAFMNIHVYCMFNTTDNDSMQLKLSYAIIY